ncbi:MurR/RpiR family transcriptional regulator [Paenibacillus urinalis]|uniref:MurR/RpiR family transcriptional regulator n=1 Tax=Paenibacillus urinalis TaxID=521520 RepID=A0AAX3MW88_9BACL|nr:MULTISPECIES: MurR/RpiR family transcriptional regulator [Paenibacillus]WDH81861.1 MurR/RpiR family transcriptional regulator [Paenibacillus urinalis]WDH97911.1 MurR/RpiR family transcriptional regulator [Paenibacillus urinalis]WDI01590.1 MurR/RpiR family transcriptional regulator [Paenibacillus urinalis]GAK42612.1 transcriptional regulator [Paenibacillus sp. TCA20]
MTTILNALSKELDQLPSQERRIAEVILTSPAEVTGLSIKELAENSGTSPATVTRFCKSRHFRGFPDFKMKLAAEISQPTGVTAYQDIVAGNSLSTIIEAIEANHLASITDTTRLLDHERLEDAIKLLCGARRIDLYGVATSSIVTQDFYQKLIRIGVSCTAFSDGHMQVTSASSLGEQDVAFAVSYSGETQDTIDALLCAKENGARTISLTSYGHSTLASIADIPLFTSSLEQGMRRGDMASRIALLHVIDIIFTGMVSHDFDRFVPRLNVSYEQVQRIKLRNEG